MRTPLALLLLLPATAARGGDDAPLKLQATIPLEGVKGRFDHLALSPDGTRLAVAALGNDTIEIIDLKEGRLLQSIRGVQAPTAGAFADGKLVMASAGDGKLHFFDESFKFVRAVDVGSDADPVRVDEHCQYVGYGVGAIAVVEKEAVAYTIRLDGHPEGFQLETKGPRIFVNVPDAGHVAVCDRDKREVVATWKLKAGDNYPLALDEENGRVLVGCRSPAKLLVLDMKDGSVRRSLDISDDVDDIFLDEKARRIYASCGDGFVDVIDADKYERVAKVPTSKGARTCLFDPVGKRLFVAVPARERRAEIRVYRTAAPQPPPD